MEGKSALPAELPLANGLTIHFEDRSRRTPGDHLQVVLGISILLRVREVATADLEAPADRIASALGDTVTYSTEKVRNFIPENLVAKNLEELKDEFLRANLAYLERPQFAGRFIMKKYREYIEKRGIDESRNSALRDRSDPQVG